MEQTYGSGEIMRKWGLNFDHSTQSQAPRFIKACENAGLRVEALPAKPNAHKKYRILEDNCALAGEEWRVSCWWSTWECSNFGRIRQIKNKCLVKGSMSSDGYWRVAYGKGDTARTVSAARMIYFTFHPEDLPLADTLTIDHISGQRLDNSISNLRAVSSAFNTKIMRDNQENLQSILYLLIKKYGYDELHHILTDLL